MFKFKDGESVALREDHGDLLKAGAVGTIWTQYNTEPPAYEVTFTGEDGKPFDMMLSEDEITFCADHTVSTKPSKSSSAAA